MMLFFFTLLVTIVAMALMGVGVWLRRGRPLPGSCGGNDCRCGSRR